MILSNLHPNTLATTGIQTVVPGTEYTASIDGIAVAPGLAKLTVFYATPPSVVRQLNGGIATSEAAGGGFTGKYLESEYVTPASGPENLVTILFPHDLAHPKATMSRLSVSGGSGATVDHGLGIVDTAIESNGTAPVTQGGDTFTGKALLCRVGSDGANVFYFVRSGTSFSTTNGPPVGFSSVAPVSLHLRDTQGHIVSTGTRVRFTHPLITGVLLDGSPSPTSMPAPGGSRSTCRAEPTASSCRSASLSAADRSRGDRLGGRHQVPRTLTNAPWLS